MLHYDKTKHCLACAAFLSLTVYYFFCRWIPAWLIHKVALQAPSVDWREPWTAYVPVSLNFQFKHCVFLMVLLIFSCCYCCVSCWMLSPYVSCGAVWYCLRIYSASRRNVTPNYCPHINWYSKFFRWYTEREICNKAIVTDPTAPQRCRYTTLWNISSQKPRRPKAQQRQPKCARTVV